MSRYFGLFICTLLSLLNDARSDGEKGRFSLFLFLLDKRLTVMMTVMMTASILFFCFTKPLISLPPDICLPYIQDYNICVQSAQQNWPTLENSMNYCCFLIDIQSCRRLLRFKICEVESSSNSITRAIHDEIKGKLSKILFIGDVCEKYKDGSHCFNNLGAIIVFLIFVLFLTGIISYTMKRHRLMKEQMNSLTADQQPALNNRLPTTQFLHSVKRVRFLWFFCLFGGKFFVKIAGKSVHFYNSCKISPDLPSIRGCFGQDSRLKSS